MDATVSGIFISYFPTFHCYHIEIHFISHNNLHPVILLNPLIFLVTAFCLFSIFYTYHIVNKERFISSFPFLSSCTNAHSMTFKTILNRSGRCGHVCFFPLILRRKIPFTINYDISFSIDVISMLRKFLLISSLLKLFIVNRFWI